MKTQLLRFIALVTSMAVPGIAAVHAEPHLQAVVMLKSAVGQEVPHRLDHAQLQRLNKAAGVTLQWLGNTRTGAHILEFPQGLSLLAGQAVVRQLANLDGVLWAEVEVPQPTTTAVQALPVDEPAAIMEFIIKLKGDHLQSPPAANTVQTLARDSGQSLTWVRNTTVARVFRLPAAVTTRQAQAIEQQLETNPSVVYADPVSWLQPQSIVPNDPDFYAQWHLSDAVSSPGGANVQAAWEITKGHPSVTVAVLDTGALFDHPDLKRSLGSITKKSSYRGWDMLTNPLQARDGNGRDPFAGDEGDWTPGFDVPQYGSLCTDPSTSSWHGSHVAGIVAATTNNHQGVSGINWKAKLLPVRVLGACGGPLDDVTDGIFWAAGKPEVPGTRLNKLSVKVINMSLGEGITCPDSHQEAIDFALSKNISVVVAAGNSAADIKHYSPAGCRGVIAVSAVSPMGDLAPYSNYGTGVTVAAPGGVTDWAIYDNKGNTIAYRDIPEFGVLSTVNLSKQRPEKGQMGYTSYPGTSMAAPVISGVISLMHAVDRHKRLNPNNIREILQNTARPFSDKTIILVWNPETKIDERTFVKSLCSTTLKGQCGAGIVDTQKALQAVQALP